MWNIIGHEWATKQLEQSIANNTDSHAYLFSGMAGIGKALLALRFAQALNCDEATGTPCLTCRTCRRIERGNHPDLRIAGMASQAVGLKAEDAARQKELKIGTVREWQRDITLRPYEARRRIFILHDAERLNEEASNAMLKTLEEPPPYATLILVANSTELLPTIVSRCRVLRLRPLPRRQVAEALAAHNVKPDDAAMLAAWSGGRIGWALQLVAQPEAVARRDEQLDALLALQSDGISAGMRWAEQRAKEYRSGEQESVFAWLELWQGWWRDLLLTAAGCPDGIVNIDRRDQLVQLARGQSLAQIHAMAMRIGQAAQQLRENGNPQLVLEHVVLQVATAR
ncbi:MAG: DNA polymerase III subunit delta' [Candidatus Viridilinea halotolerans]|uniref:DNA polymerase III subunit delta' n=1 Tax=Candidatus Viridilinea halotolerans TaxID=2491704 RepID=A0A426U2N7_9CHLR|nr:MAG: DNA polymerase III subunit delta' [Candidatus Viridilinea halotolerans]